MRSETGQSMPSSYEAQQPSVPVRSGWIKDCTTGRSRTRDRLRTAVEVSSQRTDACTETSHAGFDRVVANAGAELAHLSGILHQLGCAARLRELESLDTMRLPNASDYGKKRWAAYAISRINKS